MVGALTVPDAGAKATPRSTVLVEAVGRTVDTAGTGSLKAAVSSTLTSWLVVVVANSVTLDPVAEPVMPRDPLPPGRIEPRAVQVVPSNEYLRMPPPGLPESSAT